MRAAVIVFPGSNCDRDLAVAFKAAGAEVTMVWHKDTTLPDGIDIVGLPGGFSFGDYLRCGAIAANSPICRSVIAHAERGGYVLGICNGFQVLTELGLLPGALTRNRGLHFICEDTPLNVVSARTPWLSHLTAGSELQLPIAHGEGRYQCSEDTLKALQDKDSIALKYNNNPNGSIADIAGITNPAGNVLGLMPHPERACDPVTGCTDGRKLIEALIQSS